MTRKILWLVVSGLMVLSLVMAACGPAAVEEREAVEEAKEVAEKEVGEKEVGEKEVAEKEVVSPDTPKYGGTIIIVQKTDPAGSPSPVGGFGEKDLTHEELWTGDWAKGPAGGYGANKESWYATYSSDIFENKAGAIAESTTWTIDEDSNEGTIVYQIRQGVNWALDPNNKAGRLVGGRVLTADDVVYTMTVELTHELANLYSRNPELRAAEVNKTGPWEVTVKLPFSAMISGISRFGDSMYIMPPEVVEEYGGTSAWRDSVGTGPFMLTDYVAGSQMILDRNPTYWMTDPVGPGKGNQLPYVDEVRILIIPDLSTRQAGLRTGKIDQLEQVLWEDASLFRKTTPGLVDNDGSVAKPSPTYVRTDKPPFDDVRVRRAMMMATDFEEINQGLFDGQAQIQTFPHEYLEEYADLYVALDAPDCPESVKELYTYNPEKAKQLLAEAGYPDGFKTEILLTADQVDYYSVIKDMWSRVGVDLALDVKESGVRSAILRKQEYEALFGLGGQGPVAIFYNAPEITGSTKAVINDPIINEWVVEVRRAAVTDIHKAMGIYREMTKYFLDQAYIFPNPSALEYNFWWPWLKNYSGEVGVGYGNNPKWTQYIWYDVALKKSMGY